MTSLPPPLLDSGVLPFVELLALCLDGHLFRVGDAFAPIDIPDGPPLRAQAFARSAPRGAVADRASAAWIHGTRAIPPPHPQVCIPARRRGGAATLAMDTCHRELAPEETVSFGSVRVTTPLRTAADLLSVPGRFAQAEALEVRHLLALARTTPAQLDETLRRSKRKGCAIARSRLPAVARAKLPEGADALLSRR